MRRSAFALLWFASLSFAQEDAVVVTASRTEQRLRDAIPHTTVITRGQIRESQAVDLPSLLRTEAGFEFSQNGGTGAQTGIFMRGGRTSQMLVLIDGVRVEDVGFSQTAFQHLMLDEIERVEVVRGNVSSLYGSNAMGGVVQVFTRRGRGAPMPYADVMIGTRGTNKLTGGYGGQLDTGTRFNVTGTRFSTRGFSAIDRRLAPNANPDNDGYDNESVSANASHRIAAAHEIGASFLKARTHTEFDQSGGPATTANRSDQNLSMMQGWWEARFLPRWRSRLAMSEGTDYRRNYNNNAFADGANTRSRQVVWDNDISVAASHTISVGLEKLEQDHVNATLAGGRVLRREVDVWRLGYLGRFGDHSIQANLRGDDFSDFGKAETHFAGYGYDLTDAWRFIASHGTSFRAPTFQDLYGFGGDPTLKPERSRTGEIGMQWAAGPHRLRVVAFATRYQNPIVFNLITFKVANALHLSADGVESSYSGRLAGFDVRASLTLQDPRQRDPGEEEGQAIRRARQFGSLAVSRSFGPWRIGGDITGSGARRDTTFAFPRVYAREAGYTLVNLTARYNFSRDLFAGVRVENVLDEEYKLAWGFNTARRGVFLTVGWQP